MTPVFLATPVGSDEWLAERRKGIGASEIPVVLGLAPWGSPFDLWHHKVSGIAGELENDAMTWGRDLEAAILKRFAREHPELSVEDGGLYHHEDRPWQLATPDGLAYDHALIEKWEGPGSFVSVAPVAVVQAKAAARWEHWGEEGTDDIPVYYRAQVLWEMDVMGVDLAYVPVLVPPFGYREYVVKYDLDDAGFMRLRGEKFMASMAAGVEPDIDGREATTRALKKLHPKQGEGGVEIPATLKRQHNLAKRLEDAAKDRRILAENRIRHHLRGAQHALVDGQPVANRVVYDQRRPDSAAMKRAGIYDQYVKTSTVDKLLVRKEEPTRAH